MSPKNADIKTVFANGIDIAYKEYGNKEPLLMITGYSATMDMWSTQLIDQLSRNYRVIVFDNRGMGLSGTTDDEYSMRLFADDTAKFLEEIGIESAHVLGWSMGTNIAQELALNYPEKVRKLIMYAGECGGGEMIMPDPEVYESLSDTSGTDEEKGMRFLKLLFPPDWMEENPVIEEYFPEITEEISPENVDKQYNAMQTWEGSYTRLTKLDIPVLIITGTEDVLTPPENSLFLAGQISGSWLVQMRGAGHGAMYQYPLEMAEVISCFIEASH
ncbi:alpha/beta fold hydrolase [Methanochimaera problematica]|nr:alpha/beta hydrolase [Methanoplanus sp. FWC-SCC4]